jgi:putative FmdB family regulatory protein
MPIHDFRCPDGHVHDALVKLGVKEQLCPACGKTAEQVFLKAPQLDWSNMAMGANAGPEFIDRFDRSRKQRREQEKAHKAEHGDNLRGAGG